MTTDSCSSLFSAEIYTSLECIKHNLLAVYVGYIMSMSSILSVTIFCKFPIFRISEEVSQEKQQEGNFLDPVELLHKKLI